MSSARSLPNGSMLELQAWRLHALDAQARLQATQALLRQLQHEAQALTEALLASTPGAADAAWRWRHTLAGKALLYVGGRPSTLPALQRVIEATGATWLQLDGSLSPARDERLAALLDSADWVASPRDCLDPEALLRLRRMCTHRGRPLLVLRNASLGSLVAALGDAASAPAPATPWPICLRQA